MCFIHNCDGPAFYEERDIKAARKSHRCSDCDGTIAVGESYRHVAGKWEGGVQTFAQCRRCVQLRDAIERVERHEGCRGNEVQPSLGAMFEEVENWRHYADEFARLGMTEAVALIPAGCLVDDD